MSSPPLLLGAWSRDAGTRVPLQGLPISRWSCSWSPDSVLCLLTIPTCMSKRRQDQATLCQHQRVRQTPHPTSSFPHLRKWKSFFHLLRHHLCLLSRTHLSLTYLTFRIYAGRDQLLSPPPVLTPAWSSLLDNCGGPCPPTIHRLPEGPSLYRNPALGGGPEVMQKILKSYQGFEAYTPPTILTPTSIAPSGWADSCFLPAVPPKRASLNAP